MTRSASCEPLLGLTAALLLAAPAALGAPPADERAAADALFTAALVLADGGDADAACAKFDASLALFKSASTTVHVGRCREREGKLASAWTLYRSALALCGEMPAGKRRLALEELANQGAAALEPRLPRLRIVIVDAPAGTRVVRDGVTLPAAALEDALPVDPGAHEIAISAPGYHDEHRTVTATAGHTATTELTLVPLLPGHGIAARPTDGASRVGPAWAWASGGAGVALLGASAFFLAEDLSAISALRAHCGDGTRCAPGYDYAADNARKDRNLALFIGFASAGALALGAAITGVALARRAPPRAALLHAAPWAAPGAGGVAIEGRLP